MTTTELTPASLAELKALIEQTGFLPTTNKAERLFAAAEQKARDKDEIRRLRDMFREAGYLPRSRALRLVEMASA